MSSELSDFIKDLQRMYSSAPAAMKKGLAAGAEIFEEVLKVECPVYTGIKTDEKPGELRDSIRVEIQEDGEIIITSEPYALYLEYGTSKMAPHPWIRTAYEKSINRVVEAIEQVVFDELEKIFLGGG